MLGIVILNYKKWKLVVECISAIEKYKIDCDYHIYIVDNGSANESYNELKGRYNDKNRYTVIPLERNLGFSAGNNAGAKIAIKDGCEYLLITNSDVIFCQESINNLMSVFTKKEKCLLAFPKVYNRDDTLQIGTVMIGTRDFLYDFFMLHEKTYKMLPKRIVKKYELDKKGIDKTIKVNGFEGCCFMVKSKEYLDIGMLDENVFLYNEENILTTHIENNSYEIYYEPAAAIYHLCGESTTMSKQIRNYYKESRMYYIKDVKKYNKVLCSLDGMLIK